MALRQLFFKIIFIILSLFFIYFLYKNIYSSEYLKTEILFGRNFIDKTELSSDNWNSYVDEVVTKFFPYGLTITESEGQMFDGSKIEKQRNFGLLIIHKNDKINKENIEKIIQIFRKKYNNELQVIKIQENNISVNFYNRNL